jgi:hypothetical protein
LEGWACWAGGAAALARAGACDAGAAAAGADGWSSGLDDGDAAGSERIVVTTFSVHTAGLVLPVATDAVSAIIPPTLMTRATGANRHAPTRRGGATA